jgi:hypothetical protein
VRPLVVLGALTLALAACDSSPAPKEGKQPLQIAFGVQGGNLAPWKVVITRDGAVDPSGSVKPALTEWSAERHARVSRLVRQAFADGLSSRHCPRTLPDVASRFIEAAGRRVTVHGACEPRFESLFEKLSLAVGLGRA